MKVSRNGSRKTIEQRFPIHFETASPIELKSSLLARLNTLGFQRTCIKLSRDLVRATKSVK
jgi:hypothetical protein